jgi:diadenosine tetraphosphate (Ap4A) HIT family hydrolase
MAEAGECYTCTLLEQRERGGRPLWDDIYRTRFWYVVHAYDSALPGWLVLVARRHIEAVAELTPEESAELGSLITLVSQVLQSVTGCLKTYVIQFAEAAGHPHVHVHIVPRMAGIPEERRGPRIFGYLGAAEAERVPEAAMDALAAQVRALLVEQAGAYPAIQPGP